MSSKGALDEVLVVDLSRLTPGPYCTMLLADFGATVIRIDPPGGGAGIPKDPFGRGKQSICLDLKQAPAQEVLLRLVEQADVLVEGFRPGVASRLGADPELLMQHNPRLVYCSLTGWGQEGPFAQNAGHDINYLALSGALGLIGRGDQPPNPPLNLLGDMGGGGLLAAFGILAAIIERERSGRGQYIDAAMIDGVVSFNAQSIAMDAAGYQVGRGTGFLDGGAPFYDTYETSDGKFIAVGAIERRFFSIFWRSMEIDEEVDQDDQSDWPRQKELVRLRFLERSRAEWESVFAQVDACVSPVLDLREAPQHPHNAHRMSFVDVDGVPFPAPAPRLARTPGRVRSGAPYPGVNTVKVLTDVGYSEQEIADLQDLGAVE